MNMSLVLCSFFDDNLWPQADTLIVLLWDRSSLNSPLISKRKQWSFSSACVKIRDDIPSLNLRKSVYLSNFHHADGPTLSSALRRIVVYLLTEPYLVTRSSMFCTLISWLNLFSFFTFFLERNLSVVTFGCGPSLHDVLVCVILHANTSVISIFKGCFQLLMQTLSLTVAVSLFFFPVWCWWVCYCSLFSQWDRSEKNCNKRKV